MSEGWVPPDNNLEDRLKELSLSLEDVSDDTRAVSSSFHYDGPFLKPLVQPIYHTSTYLMNEVDDFEVMRQKGGYIYMRLGNPTCNAAEVAINSLEGGAGSLVFSTGMAAITTALSGVLKAGDHIVYQTPLYSYTKKYISTNLAKFNIESSWVPAGCLVDDYKQQIKPNTRVLYGETPCNPLMTILDLEEFGKLGREHENIITMIDVTFAGPYLVKPIKYGVDIVIHSGTKYLGGHSDLMAGVLTVSDVNLWKDLLVHRSTLGNTLSPFDASLLTRGIKSLHVRMERHCYNAMELAQYLDKHPKVLKVFYPGLPSDPGHEIAKKQMKHFGGMISFEVRGGIDGAKTIAENVRLIRFAVSLGGTESLIEHPASMTHGRLALSDADMAGMGGVTDGLLRFSVGLEDVADLKKDLEQALNKIKLE